MNIIFSLFLATAIQLDSSGHQQAVAVSYTQSVTPSIALTAAPADTVQITEWLVPC